MVEVAPIVGDENELGEEYEVDIVDVLIHTPDHPFCDDMTCPCHSDDNQKAIEALGQAVTEGLASVGDADRIFRGRTV